MSFEKDIFISYAHLDNQPLIKDAEGWVSKFHRALEVRVDQLLGKKSSVWRDPKLQGNDYFDDTIVEQLPGVAVLVSVFTPRYVQSESCTRELAQFCAVSEQTGGLRVRDKTRIFKVLKTPVPVEEHPEPVRDCLGYEFFKIDPVSGRVRELNQVFGADAEREFWIKLDDLAQDLCQLLEWLERGVPAQSVEGKATVYLATCAVDVRDQHDRIRRDLLGHDCTVLPGEPLPLELDALVPRVREMLAQSRLSIHMVGGRYGVVPEGTDRSLVELQNELAIEREAQGNFSRLVWIAPDARIEDERQQRFVDLLRADPRTQSGADLLETPLEDLGTQIHELLTPRPAAADEEVSTTPGDLKRVYLMCDARDTARAATVADALFEHGCEVMLPAFEGDEAAVREDHEDNLRNADGLLIYYASPNELWLRSKLREKRKSAGLGRSAPLKAAAILVAPPNSTQGNWLRTHEARVIRQTSQFTPELLDPFLTDLRS